MAIFPISKSFLSVVLTEKTCKFLYRKLSLRKQILDEKSLEHEREYGENLSELLHKFTDIKEKNLTTSVLIDDENQQVSLNNNENEEFCNQNVDTNFNVVYEKAKNDEINDIFNLNFSSHITLFKVLYFLLKNQNFTQTSMFVLVFNNKLTFVVADLQNALYSDIIYIKDDLKQNFDDKDELFIEILKSQLNKFYATKNSDFIANIFIYDDGSLSNEIGYVIFTKIFIKTNLMRLNIVDFINKICIKESY